MATDLATNGGDRTAVLERRRALRKAKKARGKSFKQEKQRARAEKKQEIVAKIRAKRDEAKNGGGGGGYGYGNANNGDGNGCWLCGANDHQKSDCPNRAAADLTKTCFQCRRRGHTSQNCPQSRQGGGQSAMCFNCGGDDHQLRDCPKPRVNGGATYATCFVCNQTGHLSSRCPQSTTGVYPKGGCCKICRSVEHLARDCPSGSIAADGSSGGRKNTKKTFGEDESEDETGAGNAAAQDDTGDAWDSFDLGDKEDAQGEEKAKPFAKKLSTKHVKF